MAAERKENAERAESAMKALEKILALMDIESKVSQQQEEDALVLNIETSDSQILIDKKGQALDALQFLVNRMTGRGDSTWKRIVVDCGQYRKRRAEQLKKMAREVADRVKKEKIPYAFDASLTAAERRIIHMELVEDTEVSTQSEGDDEERRLVVMPRDENDDE